MKKNSLKTLRDLKINRNQFNIISKNANMNGINQTFKKKPKCSGIKIWFTAI